MLQFGLNIWAGQLFANEIQNCIAVRAESLPRLQQCHLQTALHWGLAVACLGLIIVTGVLFGYLSVLHAYLLLTGQTMFEILRGSKVGYLAPYYRGRARTQYCLPDELFTLFRDELMGRGPPKPFSQGMVNNVLQQVSRRWPRPYIAQS